MSSEARPVQWLRTQIKARLALAREAGAGAWQTGCTCESDCPGYPACEEVRGGDVHIYSEGGHDSFQAEHIAANDPQDTIARCEAELAILDEHKAVANFCGDWLECAACGPNNDGSVLLAAPGEGESFYPCTTVRLLAGGYKHWPGYREEDWKP